MDLCLNLQLLPIANFPTHFFFFFNESCFFTCLNCRFANIWSLKYELRKDGCDLVSSYHLGQGFPGGLVVEILPAVQETPVRSLGGEDPLKKEMATHSGVLAWKTPWTEEPGGLQSVRSCKRHTGPSNWTPTVTVRLRTAGVTLFAPDGLIPQMELKRFDLRESQSSGLTRSQGLKELHTQQGERDKICSLITIAAANSG